MPGCEITQTDLFNFGGIIIAVVHALRFRAPNPPGSAAPKRNSIPPTAMPRPRLVRRASRNALKQLIPLPLQKYIVALSNNHPDPESLKPAELRNALPPPSNQLQKACLRRFRRGTGQIGGGRDWRERFLAGDACQV